MSRNQNEGLCLSPVMTPHRVKVSAADSADYGTISPNLGIDTHGYDDIVADVVIEGAGDVTINVLYWSPTANKFLPSCPATTVTMNASSTIRFSTQGRKIFTHISGAAVGTSVTRVDVDVAAASLRNV